MTAEPGLTWEMGDSWEFLTWEMGVSTQSKVGDGSRDSWGGGGGGVDVGDGDSGG